jgi:hypothetical protein
VKGISYPYDSSTKGLMKAIDSQRLQPDLVDLLDESQCYYYDGNIYCNLYARLTCSRVSGRRVA